MSAVSPDERQRILDAVQSGTSLSAAARAAGRGKATVSRIVQSAGIVLERSATKKAAGARRDYAHAERLDLLNEGFDRARDILASINAPHELQQWSVAVGTLIDKRRLEDGEATSRAEVNSGNDARARLAGRLDELATRRAARAATG